MTAVPPAIPEAGFAIRVRDLRKAYGETRAVDGISFEVRAGEVFGLLGPNGAGKTTTVEILEGLRSLRQAMVGGTPFSPLWICFAVLAGFLVACFAISARFFRWT
ncbi:MAG: ATP-binding cassette domain-containing protein [Chloroflexota bacterium]